MSISALPRELRRQLLLYFDYDVLTQFSGLDARFWMQKASAFGVSEEKFARCCEKYELDAKTCYLRYLTLKGREIHRGSEKFMPISVCARWAGKRGDIKLVNYFVGSDCTTALDAMQGAARKRNYALLEELEKKYPHRDAKDVIVGALARCGDTELLMKLLESVPELTHHAAESAARGGHIVLFEALHARLHTVHLSNLVVAAAASPNLKLLQHVAGLCFPGILESNELLLAAIVKQRVENVRYLLSVRRIPFTEACYIAAAECGAVECFKLLVASNSGSYQHLLGRLLRGSVERDHWEFCEYLISQGVKPEQVLLQAVIHDSKKIVRRLLQRKRIDVSEALEAATIGEHFEIERMLREYSG